jgi:hypothetical protein
VNKQGGRLENRKDGEMEATKMTYGTVVAPLEQRIYTVRGQRVMLDADLAEVYGVETRALVQAVKRNAGRFPADFVFQMSEPEWDSLRSQIVISKGRGGRRYRPYVFTEHGAVMAANVLNSPRATQMSVFVVRAFIKMRAVLSDNRKLARKLAELERKLSDRLDVHEQAILHLLRQMQDLLNPPAGPEPPKKEIGFHVRERRSAYRVKREANTVLPSDD